RAGPAVNARGWASPGRGWPGRRCCSPTSRRRRSTRRWRPRSPPCWLPRLAATSSRRSSSPTTPPRWATPTGGCTSGRASCGPGRSSWRAEVPRISAESVAAHVARQEAAVLDAAVRLFSERGYSEVTIGDIAAEVGLARNSLYRYFPDKDHILLAWFRRELPGQVRC